MILLPAIDLHNGECVRLLRGDYTTAHKVAESAVDAALRFQEDGARWLHMVDLDGAKAGTPLNQKTILDVKNKTNLNIEVGGGIRSMETVEFYLENGIQRVILGSAALNDPAFVQEAVKKYRDSIAVGIDALKGKVAAEGWTETSETGYLELARRMEAIGVRYLIFTDISQDGTMNGPNLEMLDQINNAVSCDIIASGGVSNLKDIVDLYNLHLYGAIAGKAIYAGALDLRLALTEARRISGKKMATSGELDQLFLKSDLIPAIIQEAGTDEVLMLAYMNRESLQKTFETGYTWFWSRSRQELWNKGATSGHTQKVVQIFADCDDDTLLIKVHQTGPACHTGSRSCFFKKLL